jgi:hypothetical protein
MDAVMLAIVVAVVVLAALGLALYVRRRRLARETLSRRVGPPLQHRSGSSP